MLAQHTLTFADSDQPALQVEYDSDIVQLQEYEHFANTIQQWVSAGERFAAEETVQIGWSVVKVVNEAGQLVLFEPRFQHNSDEVYSRGITLTLLHLRIQLAAYDSCDFEQSISFPSVFMSAQVQKDITSFPAINLVRDLTEDMYSGWLIYDAAYQGDALNEDDFEVLSLYEIVCMRPDIIPFMALPDGIGVTLSPSGVAIWNRQGEEYMIKQGSLIEMINSEEAS